MIIAASILAIIFFAFGLKVFGVVEVGNTLMGSVNKAFETLFDKSINDENREKILQKASIDLFGIFFSILFRFALIFLVSFMPIWIMSLMGFVVIDEVIAFLSRWDVIIIVTVLMTLGYFIVMRFKSSVIKPSQTNYSPIDRLVHMIAFSDPKVQLMAADIEKKVFGKVYRDVQAKRPIFITSLPRAGTTLMLEVLHRFPTLATHTYRDMPFVMAPILWERFSKPFRKLSKLSERAHGDGMQIGYDSPEAFEEVLWRTFWPEKYNETGIALWGADDEKKEADLFFTEHMKKVIALRRPDRKDDGRYISKNNGNIARLDLIGQMFPDAQILLIVRNPIEHANSLLRQYKNFLKMHKDDPFVRRYMDDIGHYEFGDLHRPIAFPGIEKQLAGRDPLSGDYWLAYWIAAFEYVLEKRNKVIFLSYEDTCINGKNALRKVCAQLDISEDGVLEEIASIFKAPSTSKNDQTHFDQDLQTRAQAIYTEVWKG